MNRNDDAAPICECEKEMNLSLDFEGGETFCINTSGEEEPLQVNGYNESNAHLQLGGLRMSAEDCRSLSMHFAHLANILEGKSEN